MDLVGVVTEDEIKQLIGPMLSNAGSARIVYEVASDSAWVIKEGREAPYASNNVEWDTWEEIKETALASKFAECRAVSNGGKYLVMERLNTNIAGHAKPDLPIWLTDRKSSGLGVDATDKVKVLDYAQQKPHSGALANAPMQPWPSGEEVSGMADIMRLLGGLDS